MNVFFGAIIHDAKIFDRPFNQSLILASFFKDIGMSLIDKNLLGKKSISLEEKKEIDKHPRYSKILCEQQLPMSITQLKLIEHHHDIKNEKILFGPELTLLHASDVLCAMTSERPYRPKNSLYKSLEYLKHLIPNVHQEEFKVIVNFSSRFFLK